MNSMRQLGTALLYALVSVVLVVGGLSLAMVEGGLNALRPTARPSATALASSTTPPQASSTAPLAASSTPLIVYVTATQPLAASATSQAVYPTVAATLQVYPTSTSRTYYPTAVHCGPYYGWLKNYTVQQGDTLFHISTLYQTTVPALQTANCLKSTFIYPGELLWVPNVPTVTPGVTLIPTFPSYTPEGATLTPFPYFTETATATPTVTSTPTDTAIPDP